MPEYLWNSWDPMAFHTEIEVCEELGKLMHNCVIDLTQADELYEEWVHRYDISNEINNEQDHEWTPDLIDRRYLLDGDEPCFEGMDLNEHSRDTEDHLESMDRDELRYCCDCEASR